jgi:hypothetical protein
MKEPYNQYFEKIKRTERNEKNPLTSANFEGKVDRTQRFSESASMHLCAEFVSAKDAQTEGGSRAERFA